MCSCDQGGMYTGFIKPLLYDVSERRLPGTPDYKPKIFVFTLLLVVLLSTGLFTVELQTAIVMLLY
jgi:hypothetical protein